MSEDDDRRREIIGNGFASIQNPTLWERIKIWWANLFQ